MSLKRLNSNTEKTFGGQYTIKDSKGIFDTTFWKKGQEEN
jgi:hypothetical protein